MTEFEFREFAGEIFEQQLRYENSTNYYILYTVKFALTRRKQSYKFYYKFMAQNS